MKKMKIKKNNKVKEKKVSKGKVKNIILAIILIMGIGIVSLILVFALYIIISSPDFDKEKLYSKESSVIYYDDGVTELARLGDYDRELVSYDELPQVLIDAIVATEDSRFFQHSGLDVARFLKASIGQVMGKKNAGGASTITMQVVKSAYTSTEDEGIKGIIRKFTDIYMSVFKVESNYTKEEIIEFYVNSQWFVHNGNNYSKGIAGVELACQYFFGKSVSDINLAEASIIAGMFQNPSLYNPYTHTDNLANRQKTVLKLMVDHGYISQEEMDAVLEIPILSLFQEQELVSSDNMDVIDLVRSEVQDKTGYDIYDMPIKVVTTIKKDVQDVLVKLRNGEIYTFPNEYLEEGIAITDTQNGAIVGISGGRNYTAKSINWATQKRQPGSTAKIIFDYGPYIEYLNGSPSTLFLDEAWTYSNGTEINNSDRKYQGLITMRTALVNSRNIPALKAFQAVYKENPDYIKDFAHNLGIDYGDELYESASIGGLTTGVSPIQMSAAYAAFGRGGYYIEPYIYTSVTLIETGEVFEYKYEKTKVMSEETAYLITDMLMSATDAGVGGCKVSGTEIASKGGTSNVDRTWAEANGVPTSATRDAWNITYSNEYSIALWIGYGQTTKEHYLTTSLGGTVRNAVMKAVGSRVYSKGVTFTKPSGIVSVEIEEETFPTQLPSTYTPADLRTVEIFKEGAEPTEESTRFATLNNPTGGSYSFDGTTLKLSWNPIGTPDAIDTNYLTEYFNTYYDNSASNYYQKRISYNNSYIGSIGYDIYEKNSDGTLRYLGRSETASYNITSPTGGNVTYVVKAAYSIFKANASNGLEITTNTNVDTNIQDMVTDSDIDTDTGSNSNHELE